MNWTIPAPRLFVIPLLVVAGWTTASAQTDTVYPVMGDPIRGKVTDVAKGGVRLQTGQNTEDFNAGQIEKIMFQGDPSELTRGREFALDGQYDQALEQLRGLDTNKISREVIEQDASFYRIFSQGRLALAGKGDKQKAIEEALQFARQNSDSWHFYEIAELLGDLELASNNHNNALRYYGSLTKASGPVTKLNGLYHVGLTQLNQGNAKAALSQFEKVLDADVRSVATARLQTLAAAGKAVALARQGDAEAGLKLVSQLIKDLETTDAETAARVYNAQGASYLAAGDTEGAILAFLHTHLMFSSVPDAHAEALSKLTQLWTEIGQPGRAAEMRQELKQRYPGYSG